MTRTGSAQAAPVALEAIAGGVAQFRGGHHRAVLAVEALSFALLGDAAREATLAGFAAFLNGLTFPVQLLVRIVPADHEEYAADLERRADEEPSEKLAALARDHATFVRDLGRGRALLERRFYVVVPAPGPRAEARSWRRLWRRGAPERGASAAARDQLGARCEEVAQQLARCGLTARRLDDVELAQLHHACWSPELSRVQRLRRALAEYTTLVVRGRRVEAPSAPVFRLLRRGKPAGALSPDARRFALGTRALADLVAPAAFEVARDHVRLESQLARVLAVTAYPRTVEPGWLAPLVGFDAPLELAIHVHPLESAEMVPTLTGQMVRHESSRMLDARGGRLADPEREVAYEDAERLRDALQRREEKLFSVGLYLLVRAATREALDALTRRVEGTLDGMLAHSRVAVFEQEAGFRTCLPEGTDHLLVRRNLDTSSLATAFPFTTAALSMERGVLYGVARDTHAPLIFDPFSGALENANLTVFATSGAGKSYFTKLIAARNLLAGVDFLVIDPEDEYRALCAAVGGQRVRLASSSSERLNPFDLPPPEADGAGRDPLAEQVAALIALLEVMLAEPGRPLGGHERALLDRALYRTYAAAGVTSDPATHAHPPPLLADLLSALGGMPDQVAADLALRLERYVTGSLGGLFAGPTSVSLEDRFVVFDVQALEAELRPLAIHLIASFVWNQVRRRRRPRLLVVDEAWTLLRYPEGGAFLASMARRARKYHLGLVTITQDVADFLGDERGRTVLTNAAVKLLMKQDPTTIEPVAQALQLSPDERRFLLGAAKGEGLLFARGTRVPIAVRGSTVEHTMATTGPEFFRSLANSETNSGVAVR